MKIIIKEVTSRGELKQFVKFPTRLYKGNKYFVPALFSDELYTLQREKNPAFDNCEAIYFLAYSDNRVVGRIAGIINNMVNAKESQKRVRFGFVDFIDNTEVSLALFSAVEQWAKSKGMQEIHGPLGFTDMDPEGMLVDGFDKLGTMVAIYNHPYYMEHLAGLGFRKDADWVEYLIEIPQSVPEKHERIAKIVAEKYGLKTLDYTSRKKVQRDYGVKLFKLVNEAYNNLYGYSPLTERQISHYIRMYIPMLKLNNLILVSDADNNLVGMAVAMPLIAKALQKSKGRLFPFGFIHLLRALWGKNSTVELLLIAIRPEFQNKGVNAMIWTKIIAAFNKNGYKFAESNPELEVNLKVQNLWQDLPHTQHKRRRAFVKELN